VKKRILTAIIALCLAFLFGGAYIIATMERATSRLNHLVNLHRIEILREQVLVQVKDVHSYLSLMGTPHAPSADVAIGNVRDLEDLLSKCFKCHRSANVLNWIEGPANQNVLNVLQGIENEIEEYKGYLSRLLTMRANLGRIQPEFDKALKSVQSLAAQTDNMIIVTSARLSEITRSSYKDIFRIKIILYIIVVLAPFVAAGLGFIYIRQLTGPLNLLLTATRKLKSGDLNYTLGGLKDEFGEVAASFNDMAVALKQQMRELEESEKRYRTLFESAGDAIFIVEGEGEEIGRIVDANVAAAEMHGYTLDELLGMNLMKHLDSIGEDQEVIDHHRRILAGEWIQAERSHRKKDGTVFPVAISAGLLEYMDHKYIIAIHRDITDRRKMENQLLQSKLDWEDTFDTITDIITIHDKEFNIIRANKAAKEILGLPPSEAGTHKCYDYYHGEGFPPKDCPTCECFNTQKPAMFETYEPHLDMYLEIRAMPRFDNNEQMVGLIHIVRDITERKRTQEALQRAEQMKLVGELATGLAHEIKNFLAGIKASVEFLQNELELSEEDGHIISLAVDEIKRIDSLIKSLLNFAKPAKPKLVAFDINETLDKTVAFALKYPSLSSTPPKPILASKDYDKNLPKILADPMQVQQALLNLIINAIEAMPEGGDLGLRTRYDAKLCCIKVMISDTGMGMEEVVLDRIFQPFFTTKGKGTGLGLSITRRLIEQNGGSISVESHTGKGTVFSIFLSVNKVEKAHML